MKYIIDIPNEDVGRWVSGTPYGLRLFVPLSIEDGGEYHIKTEIPVEPYTEPDRKAIEDEVWEFAWEVLQLELPVFREIFGYDTVKMDYRDFKYKYEAWLKQKDGIHVGDEIYSDGDYEIAIVMEIHGDESVIVYTKSGCIEHWWNKVHNLKKTGRHFPEVAKLLKKMRGEEE